MCGYVGIVNYDKNLKEDIGIMKKMCSKISYRGPDETGYYTNENVLLGHNRLVVIDKSGGVQPMIKMYNSNEYTIVYNGQIYNTDDIRKELEKANIKLDSYSDTEVILKAFILFGFDVVYHLNGIFSFAIWNKNKKELFIARDHLGVKPLFYTFKNNNLIFASEIKCLFEHPDINPILNKDGICELFGIGPAHTPRSYYI